MIGHKRIDMICILSMVGALLLVAFLCRGEQQGIEKNIENPAYVTKLFDDSYVHRINLEVEDWANFLEEGPKEEYVSCNVKIDGEEFKQVGLRVKGNNSKALVTKYGLDRYSLKIEFDHYNSNQNYYGLDKLSLDSSFQDNSYLKNYMTMDMMAFMGVPASLCSYAWITVNGQDWGLYLAMEEPEEAFARRNYGTNYGKLYKPDYKNVNEENLDVGLCYIDEKIESYDNIFRNSKFATSEGDKKRLIQALKILNEGKNIEDAVDVDQVLRYFTVQVFVVNLDSYLGPTGHNYFLHEQDGRLSMIPWDYNLAYCTYSLGKPEPVNDARLYVNYPIDTPAEGTVMLKRPMYHQLMLQGEYYQQYHKYFSYFIETYFKNGYFERKVAKTTKMIAPYVEKDPTAFISYEDYRKGVETYYNFCSLRAESVEKQLEGIIPSTIRGQEKDKRNFVDASNVWLPDMGEVADLKDGR